jgi:glycosyltransferase involved in cell wall biosynthesis
MNDLAGGGAERTVNNILLYLPREKFLIFLVLNNNRNDHKIVFPPWIKIIILNKDRTISKIFALKNLILLHKPDILFSTIYYNNHVLIMSKLLTFKNIKIIIRETTNRPLLDKEHRFLRFKSIILYKFATKVIFLTEKMRIVTTKHLFIPYNKSVVIGNPLDTKVIHESSILDKPFFNKFKPYLLFVGRLVTVKNISMIIKSFKLVSSANMKLNLLIIGEGPEKENLIKMVKAYGLINKVYFLGFQSNPYNFIKNASCYILTSKYEGFSHTILESFFLEVPVIATNCDFGPSELLDNGKNGSLVEVDDVKSLKNIIIKICSKRTKAIQNKIKNAKTLSNSYTSDVIINLYENIFSS